METVTVQVPHGVSEQVRAVAAAGRQTRWRITREPRWEATPGAGAGERAALRGRLAEHLAGLRQAGELLDTIAAVVETGARRELARRGWDHDWPPVPAEARLQGRWPGSRDHAVPERLVVRVDDVLATRVRAACWWTSEPAIRELRAWRDRHPGLVLAQVELEEYERLSLLVTTTGDLWRAGLRQVLAEAPTGG